MVGYRVSYRGKTLPRVRLSVFPRAESPGSAQSAPCKSAHQAERALSGRGFTNVALIDSNHRSKIWSIQRQPPQAWAMAPCSRTPTFPGLAPGVSLARAGSCFFPG